MLPTSRIGEHPEEEGRMAQPTAVRIRVGICSCVPRYRGRIGNTRRVLGFAPSPARPSPAPRSIVLEEHIIPKYGESRALRLARCHIFVDVHPAGSEGFFISIIVMDVRRDRSGREQLVWDGGHSQYADWIQKRLPSPRSIIANVCDLVRAMTTNRRDFTRWLARMRLPKQPTARQ